MNSRGLGVQGLRGSGISEFEFRNANCELRKGEVGGWVDFRSAKVEPGAEAVVEGLDVGFAQAAGDFADQPGFDGGQLSLHRAGHGQTALLPLFQRKIGLRETGRDGHHQQVPGHGAVTHHDRRTNLGAGQIGEGDRQEDNIISGASGHRPNLPDGPKSCGDFARTLAARPDALPKGFGSSRSTAPGSTESPGSGSGDADQPVFSGRSAACPGRLSKSALPYRNHNGSEMDVNGWKRDSGIKGLRGSGISNFGFRILDCRKAESGIRKEESGILGSLGGAGSMTPPAIKVQASSSQRGGLHRGRPTMAQSRGIQGRLNVFMQKEVRLSRFQSGSYTGGTLVEQEDCPHGQRLRLN